MTEKKQKKWTEDEEERLKKLCQEVTSFPGLEQRYKAVFPERSWYSVRFKVASNPEWSGHFKIDGTKNWRGKKEILEKICRSSKSYEEIKQKVEDEEPFKGMSWDNVSREISRHSEWTEHILKEAVKQAMTERKLPEPEVLEVSNEAFEKPGTRIGFISRIDFKGEGFRAGLIKTAADKFVEEGTHFNVIVGGLVDKVDMNMRLKEFLSKLPKKAVDQIEAINHFLNERARELSWIIPTITKPGSKEYIRWYIITAPPYDGWFGEEIARRMQILRPEDVRH